MRQFAVIGLGRFGSSLATALADMGHEVLGVDKDPDKIQALSHRLTHVVQADPTDEATLKSLGIRNFDCVVVSIGHDIQASILVTLMLKEMGVKRVVAKALNELHAKVLYKIGADEVVFPEKDMGTRVAHHLVSTNVVDCIELSPDFSIVEAVVSRRLGGKTLRQLKLRDRYGLNVMAIKRGKNVNLSPQADDRVVEGDVLVVIGHNSGIQRFEEEELNSDVAREPELVTR